MEDRLIISDRVRATLYIVGFTASVNVSGGNAYFEALGRTSPDFLVGASGTINWLIGAGLLTSRHAHGHHPPARPGARARAAGGGAPTLLRRGRVRGVDEALGCDCEPACGMPALTLAAGAAAGLLLTAGWLVPTTWAVLTNVHAREIAGPPW